MATVSPEQAAGYLKDAGANQDEAAQLLSVIPGESGWRSDATNPSSGACGLWQILPPEPGCDDPARAAGIALRKLRTQGIRAWAAGPAAGDWAAIVAKVWGTAPTSSSGPGLPAAGGDPTFGIGPAIGGGVGKLGGELAAGGHRAMSGMQVVAGWLVLGAAAVLVGYLFMTRTDAGRELQHGAQVASTAAATAIMTAPK